VTKYKVVSMSEQVVRVVTTELHRDEVLLSVN